MKRPYFIRLTLTAGAIALGLLASATTVSQADTSAPKSACMMVIEADTGTCAR